MVRRKGTVALVGLPPGEFPTPIFDVVVTRITIRGSIVGTRKDFAEALAFAAEGKVRAHIHTKALEDIITEFFRPRRLPPPLLPPGSRMPFPAPSTLGTVLS